MRRIWNTLILLNKNLIIAIPVFLSAGFISGTSLGQDQVQALKALIMPLTFLMVYPMMVTLNIQNLKKGLHFRLQAITQLINFSVIPLTAVALGKIFFPEQPYLALGLLLAALLPTSGMTISWTGFARGNMGAAINMTVIGLTLGSLLTPLYVRTFLGTEVLVDFAKVIKQISIIVFLPMLLGQLTRGVLLHKFGFPEFKKEVAPLFPPLSTIGVLGIVFVAMALKAGDILANPTVLAKIIVPLILLYGLNYLVSTLVGKQFFNRGDGIALVYGTVMRNLSIALAIAITSFGQDGAQAALVIAIAYIIQVQSAAWYVKLTDRVFGALSEPAGKIS